MPRPPSGRPWARQLFSVKGRPEWAAWVDRLRRHAGDRFAAELIERALAREARRLKFPEPMPPRTET